MTIQDLGSIGELIAAIATLATLAYLAIQIRQNTRSVRSATSASVAESLSRWTETIGSQRDLARLWMQGMADPEQLDPEAKLQFSLLCFTYARRLENAFYQHSAGFLDPDHWQTTQRVLKIFFGSPGGKRWWQDSRSRFSDRFAQFIDREISQPAA